MQDEQQKRFLGDTDFVIPDDWEEHHSWVILDGRNGCEHSVIRVDNVKAVTQLYYFDKSTDCVSLVFVKGKHLSAVMNFIECLNSGE